MDEPTDPMARQMALTALTTEHFVLQSARMATISEANGRSTLYLGTLSSATIAIAFIGSANELGDTFYLFALTLLPSVFLLGIFTFLRLVQTGIEDYIYGLGTVRIREFFIRLDPSAAPFFLPTDPEGIKKLQRMGMISTSPFQGLLTSASMVACINAIVGGVAIARGPLAARRQRPRRCGDGSTDRPRFAAIFMVYGIRAFKQAAAVSRSCMTGEARASSHGQEVGGRASSACLRLCLCRSGGPFYVRRGSR